MGQESPKSPDINPGINKVEEKAKKGSGFFASLLSKMGMGGGGMASGGAGSIGAGGGMGLGGMASGGILATKAGIIGVAVIGTTVAASVGFIGYKALGGGGSSGSTDQSMNGIFHSRAAESGASGSGSAGGSGSSRSGTASGGGGLDYFVSANKSFDEAREGPAVAADPSAAQAAGSASAAPGGKNDNAPGSTGAPGPKPKLKGKKVGGLSTALGGGSGGGSSSARSGKAPVTTLARGVTGGGSAGGFSTGMKKGTAGGRRGLSARRRGGAMRQLGNVRRDHKGARSSGQSGTTYDGSGDAGTMIGPSGGQIAGGRAFGKAGAQSADPSLNPAGVTPDALEPEPPVDAGNVTPYQDELDKSLLLMGGAILGLLAAVALMKAYYKAWIAKYNLIMLQQEALAVTAAAVPGGQAEAAAIRLAAPGLATTGANGLSAWMKTAAIVLASVAIAAALAATVLGVLIATGEYAQPTQGWLVTIAGALIATTGGIFISMSLPPEIFPEDAIAKDGETALQGAEIETMTELPTLMMLAGGAGVAAGVGAMMTTGDEYDCNDEKNKEVCEEFGYYEVLPAGAPSDHVLAKYMPQENDHGNEQRS